ncbi:MAG: hypothetical protein ACR2N7_01545 [Acidimicrobiia bacterium]
MGYPFDGLWLEECELGGWGSVTPRAVVTVDGIEFWDDGPDPVRPGWWNWFANVAIVPLDEGSNELEFLATFDDGSTIPTTVTVICDSTLTIVYGLISAMYIDDEGTHQIAFDAGTMDDQPDGWAVVDTAPAVFKANDNALFVVYDRTGEAYYQTADFAVLLTEIDGGLCDTCGQSGGECPDGCFASPEYGDTTPLYRYVAFELLVDADHVVRQARQLDPTIGP